MSQSVSTAVQSILTPDTFDAEKVKFGPVKMFKIGSNMSRKTIPIYYNGKPLTLQLPTMRSPYSLGCFDSGDVPRYSMNLSFRDIERNPVQMKFFESMAAFENILLKNAKENSSEWFGKKITSDEVIKEKFSPLIRYSTDEEGKVKTYTDNNTGEEKEFPPTFKLKVPYKDGKFDCKVYDIEKNELDLNEIEMKGSTCTCIVKCNGVWLGTQFGITFTLLQARIVPKQVIQEFAFQDIEGDVIQTARNDDNDNTENVEEKVEEILVTSSEEEESEEEDDESSEEEEEKPPTPPPTVVKKKRGGRKKKSDE